MPDSDRPSRANRLASAADVGGSLITSEAAGTTAVGITSALAAHKDGQGDPEYQRHTEEAPEQPSPHAPDRPTSRFGYKRESMFGVPWASTYVPRASGNPHEARSWRSCPRLL